MTRLVRQCICQSCNKLISFQTPVDNQEVLVLRQRVKQLDQQVAQLVESHAKIKDRWFAEKAEPTLQESEDLPGKVGPPLNEGSPTTSKASGKKDEAQESQDVEFCEGERVKYTTMKKTDFGSHKPEDGKPPSNGQDTDNPDPDGPLLEYTTYQTKEGSQEEITAKISSADLIELIKKRMAPVATT